MKGLTGGDHLGRSFEHVKYKRSGFSKVVFSVIVPSMSSSHAYIQELQATISKQAKEIDRLKKKLKGKGKGLDAYEKDKRAERMRATWAIGEANYHRGPEYKKLESPENRDALNQYHADYPEAVKGDVYRVLHGMETLKEWQAKEKAAKLAAKEAAKLAKRNGKPAKKTKK